MLKIFSVDMIEEKFIVCFDDDGIKYDFSKSFFENVENIRERDMFTAKFDGEILIDIKFLPEQRDFREKQIKKRLDDLFSKK